MFEPNNANSSQIALVYHTAENLHEKGTRYKNKDTGTKVQKYLVGLILVALIVKFQKTKIFFSFDLYSNILDICLFD